MAEESFGKWFLKLFLEFILLAVLFTFIPGVPPDVKITEVYKMKKVVLDEKALANNKLDGIEFLYKDELHGPESLTDFNGQVFATVHEAGIVKFVGKSIVHVAKFGKPCKGFHQEEICGRPLGLRIGSDGFLYTADAYKGIYKVNIKTGDKIKLVDFDQEIEGKKVKFPQNLAVACNGDLYWIDSSTDFTLQDIIYALFADPTGRLIHYNAKTGKNRVLLNDVLVPNGVILTENEEAALVAETGKNRVLKHYLKGAKKGSTEIFMDGLPGVPDNIQTDGKDGYLVSLIMDVHTQNPNIVQTFSQFPNIRKLIARLLGCLDLTFKTINRIYPNQVAQQGAHFVGHSEFIVQLLAKRSAVFHVSESGDIIDTLWSTNKTVGFFSEAHIVKDQLYLGSPYNKHLGRISLDKIGWGHLKRKGDSLSFAKEKCGNKPEKSTPPPMTAKPTTTATAAPPRPPTTTTTPVKPTADRPTATPKPVTTKPPVVVQKDQQHRDNNKDKAKAKPTKNEL